MLTTAFVIVQLPNSYVVDSVMRFHNLLAEATGNAVLKLFQEVISILVRESITREKNQEHNNQEIY